MAGMKRKNLVSYRPSPGTVIAIIALIVALGGTAYAAKKIGSKQLANGAVTLKKIKNGAVGGSKLGNVIVRNATVNIADGGVGSAIATCSGTEKMLGGGARFVHSLGATDLQLISSGPQKTATDDAAPDQGSALTAWRGSGVNQAGGTGAFPLTVFAVCLQ